MPSQRFSLFEGDDTFGPHMEPDAAGEYVKHEDYAVIEEALLAALPFVEDAIKDPAYKPGRVQALARQMRRLVESE